MLRRFFNQKAKDIAFEMASDKGSEIVAKKLVDKYGKQAGNLFGARWDMLPTLINDPIKAKLIELSHCMPHNSLFNLTAMNRLRTVASYIQPPFGLPIRTKVVRGRPDVKERMLNKVVEAVNKSVIEWLNGWGPQLGGQGILSTTFPFAGRTVNKLTPLNKYRQAFGWSIKKGRPTGTERVVNTGLRTVGMGSPEDAVKRFIQIVLGMTVYGYLRGEQSLPTLPDSTLPDLTPPNTKQGQIQLVDLDFLPLVYMIECVICGEYLLVERAEIHDYIFWDNELGCWMWWCTECGRNQPHGGLFTPVRVREFMRPHVHVRIEQL